MTPKEKALELIEKMLLSHEKTYEGANIGYKEAKQCALIAVDEINKAIDFDWMEVQNLEREHAYWEKVKQEIEAL